MGSLGGGGGFTWGMRPENGPSRRRPPKSSESSQVSGEASGWLFPLKPAATAATLALTGDTIAQLRERWVNSKSLQTQHPSDSNQDVTWSLLDHNWL